MNVLTYIYSGENEIVLRKGDNCKTALFLLSLGQAAFANVELVNHKLMGRASH